MANEDVVSYDGAAFTLLFDGSDVGLRTMAIDALAVIDDDELLLSFTRAGTVPGLGLVEPADVVRFIATSLGSETAGRFRFFLDGSDVGLAARSENVDALELLPGGRVLVSTSGPFAVPRHTGNDEDVIALRPERLGKRTAGSWIPYLDGSDVRLGQRGEDVDGLAADTAQRLLLSTTRAFAVRGVSGTGADVFAFRPAERGPSTRGNFARSLTFDGAAMGLPASGLAAFDVPSG